MCALRPNFPSFLDIPLGRDNSRRSQTARRAAVVQSWKEMQEHDAWSAGANVPKLGSGLKLELVLGASDEIVDHECRRLFQYETKAEAPNKEPLKPFKCCRQRNIGLCDQDEFCAAASTATFNIYVQLARHGFKKGPALLSLCLGGLPASKEYHFLARFHGKGDFGLVVAAESRPYPEPCFVAKMQGDSCIPSTTQVVLRRMPRRAKADLAVGTDDALALPLELQWLSFVGNDLSDRWCASPGDVLAEATVSLTTRIRAKANAAKHTDELLPFGVKAVVGPELDDELLCKTGSGVAEKADASGSSQEDDKMLDAADSFHSDGFATEPSESSDEEGDKPVKSKAVANAAMTRMQIICRAHVSDFAQQLRIIANLLALLREKMFANVLLSLLVLQRMCRFLTGVQKLKAAIADLASESWRSKWGRPWFECVRALALAALNLYGVQKSNRQGRVSFPIQEEDWHLLA